QCANVDGVTNPSVWPDGNEPPRSVPWTRCAASDCRKHPKTPEVQSRTNGDQDDRHADDGHADHRPRIDSTHIVFTEKRRKRLNPDSANHAANTRAREGDQSVRLQQSLNVHQLLLSADETG